MSKKKMKMDWEKEEEIADREQTLANLIVLALVWIVFFKIMSGTF